MAAASLYIGIGESSIAKACSMLDNGKSGIELLKMNIGVIYESKIIKIKPAFSISVIPQADIGVDFGLVD